jgi:hypothetical protein
MLDFFRPISKFNLLGRDPNGESGFPMNELPAPSEEGGLSFHVGDTSSMRDFGGVFVSVTEQVPLVLLLIPLLV